MQIEEAKKENKEYIFADHFDTLEELLADCKLWIADEDVSAFCRWFDFKCMEALVNKIEKQQAELENLKEEEILDKADIEEIFRLRKENEKKDKVIDEIQEEVSSHIGFENRLKKDNEEPDLFNQGRFYVANNIKNILRK